MRSFYGEVGDRFARFAWNPRITSHGTGYDQDRDTESPERVGRDDKIVITLANGSVIECATIRQAIEALGGDPTKKKGAVALGYLCKKLGAKYETIRIEGLCRPL